ncbi:DUF1877 family protein [Streptomyces sp. NBC_00299]|uniref:DUF1877 family protein n=1 Tax=Streptomyces sp. NBC_00299 TaxID=2975705 RepID=UPI002E2C7D9E|nr:DUF1877 family protein [Streptomyces sp. NBC_00299]
MSLYFHLRAVPPPALRNSATWFQRLFEDDWDTVRRRLDRHLDEMLDQRYADQHALYAGQAQDGPQADVVLGGRPVTHPVPEHPPFLILTAAQVTRVADYLGSTGFETLWRALPATAPPEPEVHSILAAAHRDLTAFYTRTAKYGDAVVKCLLR